MGYLHGVSSPRYDELSPLDRAINAYSEKATRYFEQLNLSDAKNAPDDVKEKRKQDLAKAQAHLANERRLMEAIADVQARLEQYREIGRGAVHAPNRDLVEVVRRGDELLAEEHHPTAILEEFMRAVPNPKPSANHSAHHITPGKGKTKFAHRARVRLHLMGIRINDPDNGVWLPRHAKHTPHWSMPEALGHLQYHTEGYERWVSNKLQSKSSEAFMRLELQLIGSLLQQNKLPPEARKKSPQKGVS